jgi:hypothetical protein
MIDFPATPSNGQIFIDPTTNLQWTWDGTKWVASGLAPTPLQFPGGFVNRLRNGTFDVWQRAASGTTVTGALTYTADGWIIGASGAGLPWSRSAGGGSFPTLYSMSIVGAAGNTATTFRQRIESAVAAPLGSGSATFQISLLNNTGAIFTPTLTINHATVQDNFAGVATDVGPVNLQPCPVGVWTTLAYTFTVPQASANLGLEVMITLGALAAGQALGFAVADLRSTPGVPVGLNANPPPPELRPIATELAFCQRYFYDPANGGVATQAFQVAMYATGAGAVTTPMISLPTTMRAQPTLTFRNQAYSNSTAVGGAARSPQTIVTNLTASAVGPASVLFNMTASAEL